MDAETYTSSTVGDLADLIGSWTLHLRAEHKSPKTIITYLEAANQLQGFLALAGMPTKSPTSDGSTWRLLLCMSSTCIQRLRR